MDRILIISEKYITDNSEVQENVDINKIIRNIFIVQNTFVKRILGSALFEEVLEKIGDGTINDGAEYQDLFELYLKPITLNYSLYKALPFLTYTITNKTIVQKESDNSEGVELATIKFLQAQYKDSADEMTQECKLYLKQKYTDGLFPLYSNTYNDECDDVQADNDPNSQFYFGDIFLGF